MAAKTIWPARAMVEAVLSSRAGMAGLRNVRFIAPNSLTCLLYHRIADPLSDDFFGFPDNVSATPGGFEAQIRYLDRDFSIISLADCLDWMEGRLRLPRNAVLITFDDGYRDNLLNAASVLERFSVRALMFVSTGYLDNENTFYWDWVWEAFHASEKSAALLPILGQTNLRSAAQVSAAARRWISESKRLKENEKLTAIAKLAEALDFERQERPPSDTQLSRHEVRALAQRCFDFGSHTVSHSILSNISLEQAESEILQSKRLIEDVIQAPVRSFAYPNGLTSDFSSKHERLLERLGFSIAFRASGGISLLNEARKHPFAICRTSVGRRDTSAIVGAKAAGLGGVMSRLN